MRSSDKAETRAKSHSTYEWSNSFITAFFPLFIDLFIHSFVLLFIHCPLLGWNIVSFWTLLTTSNWWGRFFWEFALTLMFELLVVEDAFYKTLVELELETERFRTNTTRLQIRHSYTFTYPSSISGTSFIIFHLTHNEERQARSM